MPSHHHHNYTNNNSSSRSSPNMWPESYGFSLYGAGPCFVTSVQRDSIAHKSGIVPGDQLLEVDGHNVADMSADAVTTLARRSRSIPPTVSVEKRLQYVSLLASRHWGFGFTLHGLRPTLVAAVDPPGPAYNAGLRPGDIVLEVNGRKVRDLERLAPLLSTRAGKVGLTFIPVETRGMPSRDSTTQQASSRGEASRVRKARDLFAKMNIVLGNDYEKKMAVVGLLKQYAEKRNIEKFGRALNLLLNTSQQTRLVKDIRPYVPVEHRHEFDGLVGAAHDHHDDVTDSSAERGGAGRVSAATLTRFSSPGHEMPQNLFAERTALREVVINRGSQGSFGFILRGHDPVYVESVTPGSPADRAGLRPGDAILRLNGLDVRRSTHSHVVKLLQGSGTSPRIQVRHLYDEEGIPVYSPGSQSSDDSSASSHMSSSGWLGDEGHVMDQNGHSFAEKADHLLTTKERSALRKAIMNYKMHTNVTELVDDLNYVLDAPSKKTLWGFLLPKMPHDHVEYVLKYVDMPKHQLDLLASNPRPAHTPSLQRSHTTDLVRDLGHDPNNDVHHIGSFSQQLDYLLMSRERSQLKKALQIYAEKRNVQHVLEDLSEILNTPSKRTLWFYIIPLLSPHHQPYCQRRLGLPEHVIKHNVPGKGKTPVPNGYRKSASTDRVAATPRRGDIVYQQDEFSLVEQAAQLLRREQGETSDDELDAADLQDERGAWQLRARRRVPPDRDVTLLPGVRQGDSGYLSRDGEQSTVTLNPDYVDAIGRKPGMARHHVRMVRESSSQTTPRGSIRDPSSGHHSGHPNNGQPGHPNMDFKTVVHVYDNSAGRADILELQEPHLHGLLPSAAAADQLGTTLVQGDSTGGRHHGGTGSGGSGSGSSSRRHIDMNGYHRNGEVDGGLSSPNLTRTETPRLQSTPERVQINQTGYYSSSNGGSVSRGAAMAVAQGGVVQNGRYQERTVMDGHQTTNNHNQRLGNGHPPITHAHSSHSSSRRGSYGAAPSPNHHHNAGTGYQGAPLPASHSAPSGFSTNHHQGLLQNGALSDADSEASSAMKNSVTSFDSFQTKAMKAIRALDDVVANEPSELDFAAVLETPPPMPPPPPPPPPPPAPPPPPPMLKAPEGPGGIKQMHVKRMNWEKIENVGDNMIWSKIGETEDLADVVKYLELETQFSTRRNKISESFRDRRHDICILSPKKSYNISILLGHLKRGVATVKKALYQMDEQVLPPELLRQMLAYAPDGQEFEKYEKYKGSTEELSKPDQFMYQLTRVPGYLDRLQAMVFKANFSEKVEEVKHQLHCIRTASLELQNSKRLAKILELVLAMGNYMNKGHQRVGQAVGFRISFLSQLELTKTSDNKATFLHVLADVVATRFPDALNLQVDLPTVKEAAKVSNDSIENELAELKTVLEDIVKAADRIKSQSTSANNDKFQEIITNFTKHASEEIESLTREQEDTKEIYVAMVTYFGEDPTKVDTGEFFNTFSNFLVKFELELTKTSDNKATFLHVLADVVATRFPDALNLQVDLPTVKEAAKVSNDSIENELAELKTVLEDIVKAADRIKSQSTSANNDKFQEIITFTKHASEEIESLTREQEDTKEIYVAMVTYFGEDPTKVDTGEFFNTFSNFLVKFEKAHQHNLVHKRHYYKDGTAAAGPSA